MKKEEKGILTKKELLCFSFGDLGYQCVFYWVTAFLMIFYTDVFLIPAAAVSVLMLIVRLYDAINDPVIGSLMDRTSSRMGRYRPWILVGGIGLLISVIFMFWAHPDWNEASKIVYMYVTYIAVVTFSTIFYMAYMALNGCISVNSLDRTRASGARMVMSYLGMLVIGYAAPYVIQQFGASNPGNGYLIGIIISAVIALPLILVCGLGTKEVVHSEGVREKIPMNRQWKALVKNTPMLILTLCMFVHGIQMNGRLMIATYYCTYVINSVSALAVFNLLNSVFAIGGSLAAPTIFRLTGNKGKASAVILYLCAVSMALQYTADSNLVLFYGLVSITGFCYGAFSTLMFSMIPDAVDFAQLKFNVRVDGFLNAVASFGFKVGGAISISLTGVVLSFFGYVANEVQNADCLNAIKILMTIGPAVSCFLAGTLLLFYKIDRKKQREMVETLKQRHSL